MTPDRWRQVKEIFAHTATLDAAALEKYLDTVRRDDAELHAEVVSLLAAHRVPNAVVDQSAADYLPESFVRDERWIGKRIGSYEIVAKIGRGGMGEVYRARRADMQYEKEVAIKLVRGGFDVDYVLRRFRAERQILADLDHPNIARLIDGGVTQEGLPYLVMEFVDGEPIDRYCQARDLPIAARLELMGDVCSAVNYAHQRLVVHRDLKPSNILVTTDGTVKLLDFGIAKLVQPAATETESATVTAMQALTPTFASPEQILGLSITTASDVYSLGVVLYHLLTDHSPYRTTLASTSDAIREVCETEPVKPSAASENSSPRIRIDRDLDDIALKALRKEPTRRYSSVEQFSEDIRRYLKGMPVAARGDQFSYRAGKFVRRHRLQIAAAGLIAATLVGGIVAATREARIAQEQRERAERHFASVRKLADTFMFQVQDSLHDLQGATEARQLLVKTSLEYLNQLAQEAGQENALKEELAVAYEKVGDIQGMPNGQNTGEPQAAAESYAKAIVLLESLTAAEPANSSARSHLAESHLRRSRLAIALGDAKGGTAESAKAVAIFESLAAAGPNDSTALEAWARACRVHAYNLDLTGQNDDAVAAADKSIELLENLKRAYPDNRSYEASLAAAYADTALVIGDVKPESLEQSILLLRKALELDEHLIATDTVPNAGHLRAAGADEVDIGRALYEKREYREAIEIYRAAERTFLQLAADPGNVQTQLDIARVYANLGDALVAAGDLDAAARMLHKTVESLNAMIKHGDTLEVQAVLAQCEQRLGSIDVKLALRANGDRAAQLRHWRLAKEWYEKSAPRFQRIVAQVTLHGLDKQFVDEAIDNFARCKTEIARLEGKRQTIE